MTDVKDTKSKMPLHCKVLDYANSFLEICTAFNVYHLTNSILLGIFAWICILIGMGNYFMLRDKGLKDKLMLKPDEAHESICNLMPEVTMINLALFVASKLYLIYMH